MAFNFDGCTIGEVGKIVDSTQDIKINMTNCEIDKVKNDAFELTKDSDLSLLSTNFGTVEGTILKIKDELLLSKIGLPDDTNIQELKKLLTELQHSPEEKRINIINDSFLSGLNNLTGIANNILQIIPQLPQL